MLHLFTKRDTRAACRRGLAWVAATLLSTFLALAFSGVLAYAQDQAPPPAGDGIPDQLKSYTAETYVDWPKKYQNATPDFKPGDTLTEKDILKLRAFMPPGFYEMPIFRGCMWRLLR
jgi:hypothetical protein